MKIALILHGKRGVQDSKRLKIVQKEIPGIRKENTYLGKHTVIITRCPFCNV